VAADLDWGQDLAGGKAWAVGHSKTNIARSPLIEVHQSS
jgi:hypothetical protein